MAGCTTYSFFQGPKKEHQWLQHHRYKFRIALNFNRYDGGKDWETKTGEVILNSCQDEIE
jgi:hypothetical protein